MEETVRKLQNRYGSRHAYDALTDAQRQFLLNHVIADMRDGGGHSLVYVESVQPDLFEPAVVLWDTMSYLFHRNDPGPAGHAVRRIPAYRSAGCGAEYVLVDDKYYQFTLPDKSRVKVRFSTIKDKP
ncbi:hypothetical protein KY363_05185 [Candidatus Woesearchaeota archaeon]|nr:hypothetical protein [Candidatus Woesearchaeota archaeon]